MRKVVVIWYQPGCQEFHLKVIKWQLNTVMMIIEIFLQPIESDKQYNYFKHKVKYNLTLYTHFQVENYCFFKYIK